MSIAREEIFGPVLSVIPFDGEQGGQFGWPTTPTTAWPPRVDLRRAPGHTDDQGHQE
jgi:hypothetical protein